MERGSVNEPVVFGGVAVSPFDLVVADEDGVVFVPNSLARRILAPCRARVEAEARWEAALASIRHLDLSDVLEAPAVLPTPARVRGG